MRTCCIRGCRVKQVLVVQVVVFIGIQLAGGISLLINCIDPTVRDCEDLGTFFIVLILSFVLAVLLVCFGYALWRCMTILFPVACGHRQEHFSGISSKKLSEILLSINEEFPRTSEMDQLKKEAELFLDDVRKELKKRLPHCTFHCIFTGSTEEGFGVPISYQRTFPRQFDALKTDFDVMFCCGNYQAFFNGQGNVLVQDLPVDTLAFPQQGFAQLEYISNIERESHLSGDLPYYSLGIPNDGSALIEHIPNIATESHLSEDLPEDMYRELDITHDGSALLEQNSHIAREDYLLDPLKFIKSIQKAVLSTRVTHLPGENYCCNCKALLTPVNAMITGPSVKVMVIPSASTVLFEGDITFCIKCEEWPDISDWLTRSRTWPGLEDVQRITSKGFHLVAKPLSCHRTGERIPSWRYSFSVAEVELSRLVPETARKCYLALKVILKDHLQPVVPALSSYHIKTIFFHTLEKTSPLSWIDDNIEECFLTLMRELHSVLVSSHCQHYWLKNVNLFDSITKTNKKRFPVLVKKLEFIQQEPSPFIYDDGYCSFCFNHIFRKKKFRQQNRENLIDQDSFDQV